MSRARIADFADKYREQATRQVSRDLGKANGPTVQPATRKEGDAPCHTSSPTRPVTQTGMAPPTSDPLVARPITTYYRTAAQGSIIAEVKVTPSGKGWLNIVQEPNEAIQRTRTDGEAEFYHATLYEAQCAVAARLRDNVRRAEDELAAFMDREWPQD